MSSVTGRITRKKGQTTTKLEITSRKSKSKIPPAKSAEFLEKLKSLLRQYNMTLKKVR